MFVYSCKCSHYIPKNASQWKEKEKRKRAKKKNLLMARAHRAYICGKKDAYKKKYVVVFSIFCTRVIAVS